MDIRAKQKLRVKSKNLEKWILVIKRSNKIRLDCKVGGFNQVPPPHLSHCDLNFRSLVTCRSICRILDPIRIVLGNEFLIASGLVILSELISMPV